MKRSDLIALIHKLQVLAASLPDENGIITPLRVRKIRKPRTRDKRLFEPACKLKEAPAVLETIAAMQQAGISPIQTTDILQRLGVYANEAGTDKKALVRHILTAHGYEYTSIRTEDGIAKSWRRAVR